MIKPRYKRLYVNRITMESDPPMEKISIDSFVENNLRQDLRLRHILDHLGYTGNGGHQARLKRHFKKWFGMPCTDYVRGRIMTECFLKLDQFPETTNRYLWHKYGYSSDPSFSDAFSTYWGITADDVRAKRHRT